ncbi:MAG: protein phosphatase 2C domain-containing protein [bacterium]|nr:protein phosphatase 2C domain-containing protein [bacterium]
MQTAFLRGRDHRQIGRLELEGLGRAAVALTRGGARKTYSHTDPNEDCVAFALGEGGQLIVAADGHHGELGSEAAVEAIFDRFASAWTSSTAPVVGEAAWRQRGIEALIASNRAILEIAGRNQLPPAPTTFVLALLRPADDLLLHLSVGDSHLFAVDHGSAIELGGRNTDWKFTPFLGYEEARAETIEQYAMIGVRSLSEIRAVVLATDGLSEPGIGVDDPAQAVLSAVSRAESDSPTDRRAVDTCREVVEVAMRAHRRQKAGDNMGCSVVWLE